uniref:Fibronectin type-III domain-containing protein n=1 Tax=Neogobius melanostomus TaxID=47308 RepID=A0A8C6T992_9GOBI
MHLIIESLLEFVRGAFYLLKGALCNFFREKKCVFDLVVTQRLYEWSAWRLYLPSQWSDQLFGRFSLLTDPLTRKPTKQLILERPRDHCDGRTRCEIQVQRSDDEGFLHICSFPQSDIFLFDDIPLEVLDRAKNRSLYSRTVTVEDNIVQKPPSNISLIQNNNIGELLLSWQTECAFTLFYKIRFSSKSMNQTIKQVLLSIKVHSKFKETLDGLVPGEEVKVQVSARCSPSEPPDTGDFLNKTNKLDLLNVTCQWDSSVSNIEAGYTLFYKTGSRYWTQCFPETNFTDQCGFQGKAQKRMRVKLSSPMAPLNKTFYSEDFKLNSIIKTSPPSVLKQNETDKLCVSWDSPLPALSSHLQYELNYRPTTEKHWTTVASNGPETEVCLKRSWSGQFEVKVRAEPFGPEYSGQWSDWSDVLTADIPGKYCNCNYLLDISSKYIIKLKLYVWPPVPNLDKVLQGFLTDLKQQKWNSYIYEDHNKDKEVTVIQKSPHGSKETLSREHCSGSDFLNHSYLFLATENVGSKGREQRGQENIYTNMPCN